MVGQSGEVRMPTNVKGKTRPDLLLGHTYLNSEDFNKSINHPENHRPLPYTLGDIQFQIKQSLDKGVDPKALFEIYQQTISHDEWLVILNHTILKAVEEKKKAGQ
jgi:hypothetical protein